MNNIILSIICILPIIAIINLLFNQIHFLITLLSLEGITLRLVLFVPLILINAEAGNAAITVILLTFGACEASLGLGLIVFISRSYGNDLIKSLTATKC